MDDLSLRRWLSEKLADSLQGPLFAGTPRDLRGVVAFPPKATAVIGMRRAGKTTFLHQFLTQDGLPRALPARVIGQTAYEWMLDSSSP